MAIVAFKEREFRWETGTNGRVYRKEINVSNKHTRNYCNRYSYVLKVHFDSKRENVK